jgi:hypothetical protein
MRSQPEPKQPRPNQVSSLRPVTTAPKPQPPQPVTCFNPEERKQLVAQRDPAAPTHIYHLWISTQAKDEPIPYCRLLRTYTSHELATHDAWCWVQQQHDLAEVELNFCVNDNDYEEETQGKCCRIGNVERIYEQVGIKWLVWTTEAHLH